MLYHFLTTYVVSYIVKSKQNKKVENISSLLTKKTNTKDMGKYLFYKELFYSHKVKTHHHLSLTLKIKFEK